MAAIDTVQLLSDTKSFLPTENALSDPQIEAVNQNVIDYFIPEDDDQYYSQALCLSLQQCGIYNLSISSAGSAGRKREKVGQVEVENFEKTRNPWREYLNSLQSLCPILPGGGYTLPQVSNFKINPSTAIDVTAAYTTLTTTSDDVYL